MMFALNENERNQIAGFAAKTFPAFFGIAIQNFDGIPILDKERALPFYNLAAGTGRKSYSSTGTSGNPKTINWSQDEDRWYISEKRDFILPFLEGCSRVFISLGVGHGSITSPIVFNESGIEVYRAGICDIEEQLHIIKEFIPDVFYCSPSLLQSLLKQASSRGQNLQHIKKVVLNGEVLHTGIIQYFCRLLSIGEKDILDTYGSTEVGTIAYSCCHCGRYHFLPGIIPESLPARSLSDTLPLDEEILLLTSLKRTSFPVIRFATYDLVRGLERTICKNRDYYSYDRIVGRADDVLNYGELFPAVDIISLIKEYYPGRDYLIFNYHNSIDIAIEGEKNSEFEDKVLGLYPSIKNLINCGMLEKYRIHYRNSLRDIRERISIPHTQTQKEGVRIVKQRF